MTVGPDDLLSAIPARLRKELLTTFDEIVRQFRAGWWEPSELNGGKFCEVVYTVLKGRIDGTYPSKASKPKNLVVSCQALEHATHVPRSVRIQIPRMLIALYEIRNNRNVGHVGGDVDPNHMDAVCVLSVSRWILAELVRVFHDVAVDEASAVVDALTERDVAAVWEVGAVRRVLNVDLSTRDAMLLLLYSVAGSVRADDLIDWLEYGNASRFRSAILGKAHGDRLIEYDRQTGEVTLSPLGSRFVEEHLPLHVA